MKHFKISGEEIATRACTNSAVFSRMQTEKYPHATIVYYDFMIRDQIYRLDVQLMNKISEVARQRGYGTQEIVNRFEFMRKEGIRVPTNEQFYQWLNFTLPLRKRMDVDFTLMSILHIYDPTLHCSLDSSHP